MRVAVAPPCKKSPVFYRVWPRTQRQERINNTQFLTCFDNFLINNCFDIGNKEKSRRRERRTDSWFYIPVNVEVLSWSRWCGRVPGDRHGGLASQRARRIWRAFHRYSSHFRCNLSPSISSLNPNPSLDAPSLFIEKSKGAELFVKILQKLE